MRVVVPKLKVAVDEIEDAVDIRIESHRRKFSRLALQLLARLVEVVQVEVHVTKSVGEAFLDIQPAIIRRRMGEAWTQEERHEQAKWRGRYVEFNLLYDRGTHFGLKTGGNVESILSSMPPVAEWK